jgi:cysteinyl-tRNA synthetase
MALKLYNTLTRKKEIFKPIKENQVTFYHCGPTVYWVQHIGNLRGMFCADIVVRVLRYLGYQVTHVRNYTDVGHLTGGNEGDADLGEDKMEKAAKREKLDPQTIAEKYIKIFEQDTQELNILEPTFKPRATQCIQEIIEMAQTLLNKGYAYTTDLAVYFDVSKAKNYTQLSGQKLEEKLKGAGKAEVSDPQKRHPADFALWFFKAGKHKNALQYWPSPFKSPLVENGQGFPGWHIECSVMANKYLGKTIDIHMGGVEHIPVHHTNEIAQSEAANGVKFVNYWLHNEHLLVNNQKMSKSEGTGYSLKEVKNKGFNPLALRYLFLQAHYRSKQNFTWLVMQAAQNGFNSLVNQIRDLSNELGQVNKDYQKKFIEKISDDFNVPQGLVVMQELLKSDLPPQDKLATILDFDKVLGLNLDKIRKEKTIIPQEIKKLAEKREQARQNKNWSQADELRKQIEEKGYQIEDTKEGPKIRIKNYL